MQTVFPEYKSEIVLGNGKFQLDPMSYTVIYEGKEISLAPREFEVLYLLAQRPNWVIPKKNIYCSVWGSNYYDDQIPYKTVEHVVWKIRKKMGHDIIETLINVGYRPVSYTHLITKYNAHTVSLKKEKVDLQCLLAQVVDEIYPSLSEMCIRDRSDTILMYPFF